MSTGVGIFIALVAGAVFLLMQGLVVPTFGDQARTRRQLNHRLARIETQLGEQPPSSLIREKYLRSLSPLQRELESLPMMESLGRMIEQAGGTLMAYQFAVISIVATVVGAVAGGLLLHTLLGALGG